MEGHFPWSGFVQVELHRRCWRMQHLADSLKHCRNHWGLRAAGAAGHGGILPLGGEVGARHPAYTNDGSHPAHLSLLRTFLHSRSLSSARALSLTPRSCCGILSWSLYLDGAIGPMEGRSAVAGMPVGARKQSRELGMDAVSGRAIRWWSEWCCPWRATQRRNGLYYVRGVKQGLVLGLGLIFGCAR